MATMEEHVPVRVVGIDDRALLEASKTDDFREDCCSVTFHVHPEPGPGWLLLFEAEAPTLGYGHCSAPPPSAVVFGKDRTANRSVVELHGIHVDDICTHLDVLKARVSRVNTAHIQEAPLEVARAKQARKRDGRTLEGRILHVVGNLPLDGGHGR